MCIVAKCTGIIGLSIRPQISMFGREFELQQCSSCWVSYETIHNAHYSSILNTSPLTVPSCDIVPNFLTLALSFAIHRTVRSITWRQISLWLLLVLLEA